MYGMFSFADKLSSGFAVMILQQQNPCRQSSQQPLLAASAARMLAATPASWRLPLADQHRGWTSASGVRQLLQDNDSDYGSGGCTPEAEGLYYRHVVSMVPSLTALLAVAVLVSGLPPTNRPLAHAVILILYAQGPYYDPACRWGEISSAKVEFCAMVRAALAPVGVAETHRSSRAAWWARGAAPRMTWHEMLALIDLWKQNTDTTRGGSPPSMLLRQRPSCGFRILGGSQRAGRRTSLHLTWWIPFHATQCSPLTSVRQGWRPQFGKATMTSNTISDVASPRHTMREEAWTMREEAGDACGACGSSHGTLTLILSRTQTMATQQRGSPSVFVRNCSIIIVIVAMRLLAEIKLGGQGRNLIAFIRFVSCRPAGRECRVAEG